MSELAKVLSGPGLSENDLIPENGRGCQGAKYRLHWAPCFPKQTAEWMSRRNLRIISVKIFRCICIIWINKVYSSKYHQELWMEWRSLRMASQGSVLCVKVWRRQKINIDSIECSQSISMWPPWPRCPQEKTRAEPGFALIAFSIDFSRLPHAAVSIKIPGPQRNKKDEAFSVS